MSEEEEQRIRSFINAWRTVGEQSAASMDREERGYGRGLIGSAVNLEWLLQDMKKKPRRDLSRDGANNE